MKKSALALLLAAIILFPACGGFGGLTSTGGEPSSESSVFTSKPDGTESVSSSEEGGMSEDTDSSSLETDSSNGVEDSVSDSSSGEDDSSGIEDGHKDDNDDGVCDDCDEEVAITFNFFALNDLHGKFNDTDAQPGVDELSTYFDMARADNENTVILSSGDMWQGAPESNLTKGAIMTEWMNAMGFASMTLGNHEYDWGAEYVQENLAIAQFPFLAINIYDNATQERVDYCQPSIVVEQNGVKIGIIGAIGDCHSSISGEMSKGFHFKTGAALTKLVKAESDKLRGEGADFIVYSVHGDYYEYDEELSNGYIDLVFEGHTHQRYTKQDSYGVYHLQNGGDNSPSGAGVSYAEVTINYVTGSWSVDTAKVVRPSEYTHLDDHPIVDELLEKYAEQIAIAQKVLGKNDKRMGTNEVLSLCAELYYRAGFERWGEDYDIVLGGGFMSMRAPYELAAGTVRYGDLQNILPFDNQLVLCTISGRDLRENFLETDNDRYYIYCGEYGESIRDSIIDYKTYFIVTDTYSSQYADNRLSEFERYDEGVFARDLLAKYIEEGNLTTDPSTLTPVSIAEILEVGAGLAVGAQTAAQYCVRAEIINIEPRNASGIHYGNMTVRDEAGNELYVYGTLDPEGNRYGDMANPPQVGDTVLLSGSIKNFKGKIEMISATVWEIA